MTAKEIQKRNAKAENLRVMQSEDGQFFVESDKGKILYNVFMDDEESSCTCGDFAKNSKKDPNFQCKHMLAVMNAIAQQIDTAIPHNLLIHDCKFLVDIGFENNTDSVICQQVQCSLHSGVIFRREILFRAGHDDDTEFLTG